MTATTLLRSKFVWTDKSGVEHRLSEIDDRYLGNIINFLKQRVEAPPSYIDAHKMGLYTTGDDVEELAATIKLLEREQKRRRNELKSTSTIPDR